MFFLSGALFPLTNVPRLLEIVATFNPLSYGVDGLRLALIGVGHFGASMDLAVLSALVVIVLILGGYLFSRIQL